MVLLILFFVFTYLRVPETKGRTFDDIAQGFSAKPAHSPVPDSVVISPPDNKEPTPLSPTEKVPMVDLPIEKQWERREDSKNLNNFKLFIKTYILLICTNVEKLQFFNDTMNYHFFWLKTSLIIDWNPCNPSRNWLYYQSLVSEDVLLVGFQRRAT